MFRDILTSRAILAGFLFFVLIVGGSLLYNWHIRREIASELARTEQAVNDLKNNIETRHAEDLGVQTLKQTEIPLEADDTDTQRSEEMETLLVEDTENRNVADAFLLDDVVFEEESIEDVPVSPFGFGSYPKVPEGWPADTFPAPSANHELLARVRIKLLSQGTNTAGANMENGLVYPVIKGTAYVKWKSYRRPTGEVTYISDIIAHPEDGARLNATRVEKGRSLTEMDVPSDIRLVSFGEGAIDPYQFLDLP